jgi:DNA replication protein DnaC
MTTLTAAPACAICNDAGWILFDLPFDHADFGKPIRCECQRRGDAERRISALRTTSGLGAFSAQTFATFDASRPGVDEAVHAARAYAERPDGILLLTGSYGCGKTHLAMAIGNALLERGVAAAFYTVPDLLTTMHASLISDYGAGYERLLCQLRDVDVLILDDLGAERTTDRRSEHLFAVINARYQYGTPLVITSNFAPTSERLEGRLRSRLTDTASVQHITLTAGDYRALPVTQRMAA